MRRALLVVLLLASSVSAARAALAGPSAPAGNWLGAPLLALALLVLTAAYADGLVQLRTRGDRRAPSWPRAAAFATGIALTGVLWLTPVDAIGRSWFAAHMGEHLVVIIGIAPLLGWSDPAGVIAAALPASVVGRLAALQRPVAPYRGARTAWIAAAVFAATIWLWHLPAAHDWASGAGFLHSLEHITLLGTAFAFWRVILGRERHGVGPGLAALIVSLVSLQGALLSALIMFAPAQLCASYAGNPLDDQVLAGLLMCIPASFAYLASTVWALWRLLGTDPHHAR